MDSQKFVRVLRQSYGLLITLALLGALLGVGIGLLERPGSSTAESARYYSATETLGYDTDGAGQSAVGGTSELTTIGAFVTGPEVTDEVGRKLGTDGVKLSREITTVARPTTNSVDIIAFADSASRAQQLATRFSAATKTLYADQLSSRMANEASQLGKRLDDLKARRVAVEQQLANPNLSSVDRDVLNAQSDALVNQYRIAYDRFISLSTPDTSAPPLFTLGRPEPIQIDAASFNAALARGRTGQNHLVADDATSSALTPGSSSSGLPSGPVGLGALGAFLGVALGISIVVLRTRFDSKLRSRADFEDAYRLPILGGVPVLARDEQARHMVSVIAKPYSPAAEVYRGVRSALLLLDSDTADDTGALIIMISSAQPKEGKSATCANLAAAFAESGRTVLAVNCDYRRPTLHRYYGLANEQGIHTTAVHGLSVVPSVSDPKTSPGRVAAEQREFIDSQRRNYDVILLDTAPLLSASDPIDIVSAADFVLLTGRPDHTERDRATQAIELLERHRASIAGLLMIAVDPIGSDYYYLYSAYSSYAVDDRTSAAEPGDGDADGTASDPSFATASTTTRHAKKRHPRLGRRAHQRSSDDQ